MRSWYVVAWACLVGLCLVQGTAGQEAARSSKPRMQLERSSEVCSALDPSECCAQMLEIALFRATGDQVPKSAKAPVRLSCKDERRTIPENACRLIAMGRGFGAREAAQLCAPAGLEKRCADDAVCKLCVSDLAHLDWKASARACYALTYVAKPSRMRGSALSGLSRR
ncbi:MAG: hypothetical protein ABW321_35665 [Polyangiales bacterium]